MLKVLRKLRFLTLQELSTHWVFCFAPLAKALNKSCGSIPCFLTQSSQNISQGPVKPSHGFTLVELLVVISIISLLSSVVFASVNSARGKARYGKVIADFAQIRTAAELDYDNRGGSYDPDVSQGQAPSFVPTYLSVWPTQPCSSGWTYDWDNWGSRVRATLRTGVTGVYYYCIATLPDSCLTSDPATDINALASKSISC